MTSWKVSASVIGVKVVWNAAMSANGMKASHSANSPSVLRWNAKLPVNSEIATTMKKKSS